MMLEQISTKSDDTYDFEHPVDLNATSESDTVVLELAETKAFQRLKYIRFLGGIDYLLVRSPNGARGNIRFTRFQHSLGVSRLALLYAKAKRLPAEQRRLICAAALLHDIGHAPLSHSLEPVFKEVFGIAHHEATEAIIAGRVPIGKEVYKKLREHSINVEHVIALISGQETSFDKFFSGPINFDTIEGILRAQTYSNWRINSLRPETVVEAATYRSMERDRQIVDEFWSCKDRVYRHIINSPKGILADLTCQYFMRRNLYSISASDYFVTEPEIFRKLGGLREFLTSRSFATQIMSQIENPIEYVVRQFYIDPRGNFFDFRDEERYKQTKKRALLTLYPSNELEPIGLTQDMFDDDSDSSG